jgi:hypothetical protein
MLNSRSEGAAAHAAQRTVTPRREQRGGPGTDAAASPRLNEVLPAYSHSGVGGDIDLDPAVAVTSA